DAAWLPDPEALQGAAVDGNLSAQLLAARAWRTWIVGLQTSTKQPGPARRSDQRGVQPGFARAGGPGRRLALQVADRAVRRVAAPDQPGRPILLEPKQVLAAPPQTWSTPPKSRGPRPGGSRWRTRASPRPPSRYGLHFVRPQRLPSAARA